MHTYKIEEKKSIENDSGSRVLQEKIRMDVWCATSVPGLFGTPFIRLRTNFELEKYLSINLEDDFALLKPPALI